MKGKRIKSFNDILVVRCPKHFINSVWFIEKEQRNGNPSNFLLLSGFDGAPCIYDGANRNHINNFFNEGRNDGMFFCLDEVNDVITDVGIEDIILFQNVCKANHIKFNLKTMEAKV